VLRRQKQIEALPLAQQTALLRTMDKQHAHQLLDQLDPGQFEAVVRLWFYSIAGSVIAGYTDRIASILRRSIPRD
jgi:hypothetical protein